jgi:Asp-tRNA(Asn)/Glu-tRNA(Gln) amidotransferase A subunit family amidase
VPSGVASNGVPTGVQIVGRTYDDVSAFRIGAALERVRPWAGVQRELPVLP